MTPGRQEGLRVEDGAVDVRLGGEVEHGIRRVDEGSDHLRIGDVALDEREPAGHLGVVPDGRQVGLVAGVGQLVEDRDPRPVAPAQDVADVGGADEPGPAGDEQTARRRGPRPPQPTARVTGGDSRPAASSAAASSAARRSDGTVPASVQ